MHYYHLVPLEGGPAGEHPPAGGALVEAGGEVRVLQVDLHRRLGREVLRADRARVPHDHLRKCSTCINLFRYRQFQCKELLKIIILDPLGASNHPGVSMKSSS